MFSSSVFSLWALTTLLKAVICLCAWRTKSYPYWRAYTTFTLTKSLALWVVAGLNSVAWYTKIYKFGAYGESVLVLCVMASFGAMLFSPFEILPRNVYLWAKRFGCIFLGLLILNFALSSHGMGLTKTVYRAAFLAGIVTIAFVGGLSKWLGIPWRSRPLWITIGLCVYLPLYVFNPHSNQTTLPYLIAELIWLAGYLRPPSEIKLSSEQVAAIRALGRAA